ncbi:hypothetical protein BDV27DRAFT_140602 [Aspergillus caelatus]|uniref:Uncharacterized protein n=1 Tax=Aspergillus caelatus TaxID=61420 RepID=A0A5N7AJV9_9EURO|nr:uncharacterized protein BDV27DRAFT_140602 [Aspergillus caelatus]KAE8370157.1 hypothetical protein BDV27DRAFT_140602 [Aspergillus caelatus]
MFTNKDPRVCCILRGIEKCLIVPAAELGHLGLGTDPPMWSFYLIAQILGDPKTGRLSLSGISPHIMLETGGKCRPAPIMIDSDKALRWNIDSHIANLFEVDYNRANSALIGYFLGHGVAKQDLPDRTLWMLDLVHDTCDYPYYDNTAPWIKQNSPSCTAGISNRTHISSSRLMTHDIQILVTMATQGHEKPIGHPVELRSIVADISIEILMVIIDTIYHSCPPGHERTFDIRNRCCKLILVFEVQDVIQAGTQINWAYLCLGLHELFLQEDWYCNGGLYFRGRILYLIECIRGSLSNTT